METRRRRAASGAPSNVDSLASPPGLCATLSMTKSDDDKEEDSKDDDGDGDACQHTRWRRRRRAYAATRYSMAALSSHARVPCVITPYTSHLLSATAGRQLPPSATRQPSLSRLARTARNYGTPAINLHHRRRHHHHRPSPPPPVATAAVAATAG